MSIGIVSYDLWKLEVPTGRVIGDCTCHYSALDLLVLRLSTSQGHVGWGFGETVSNGVFAKPAPWITPMPALIEIRGQFENEIWPTLKGRNPFEVKSHRPPLFEGYSYRTTAIRTALWDLMAQVAELPLFRYFGAPAGKDRVRAYGSGLDFPLSEEEAVKIFKGFVDRGFKAVKVKVGHPDMARDLRRLQAVREAVGREIEIAIDANEAWTCDEAIERIRFFQREGVQLAYLEDPLPRGDVEGLARLNAVLELDVVGHDYLPDARRLRELVERQAVSRLRVPGDMDLAMACVDVATEFGVPLIFGNSMFELNVHAAVAFPQVDRLEFSGLDWNLVPQSPVRFENGFGIAPAATGHGLQPNPEMLERYSQPNASLPPTTRQSKKSQDQ